MVLWQNFTHMNKKADKVITQEILCSMANLMANNFWVPCQCIQVTLSSPIKLIVLLNKLWYSWKHYVFLCDLIFRLIHQTKCLPLCVCSKVNARQMYYAYANGIFMPFKHIIFVSYGHNLFLSDAMWTLSYINWFFWGVQVNVCTYLCMYVCMCMYMYVCIYV